MLFTDDLVALLNERAGYPSDTKLLVYEEIKAYVLQEITSFNESLEKVLLVLIVFLGFYRGSNVNFSVLCYTKYYNFCKNYFFEKQHISFITDVHTFESETQFILLIWFLLHCNN